MEEKESELFKKLISGDIFWAKKEDGTSGLYLKLNDLESSHLKYNAVGAKDGKMYYFKEKTDVRVERHSWEWAVGYQATENCLECERPKETSEEHVKRISKK